MNHSSMIAVIPKNWKKRDSLNFLTIQLNSKLIIEIKEYQFSTYGLYLPTFQDSSESGYDIDIW